MVVMAILLRIAGRRIARAKPRVKAATDQVWAGPLSEPIELKLPTVPILRSCEIAVTSCAGANGFVRRMLFGTPCTGH